MALAEARAETYTDRESGLAGGAAGVGAVAGAPVGKGKMPQFHCSSCGRESTAYPRPGSSVAQCSYCGASALPVLSAAGAAPPRKSSLPWVLVGLGVAAAMGIVAFKVVGSAGDPQVLLASRRWVPAGGVATPIVGQVRVRQRGRRVYISLAMADAQGNAVRALKTSSVRRPSPPKVTILDGQGNVVYECRLRYG